ncbi:MAG: hypothetical protein K8I27_16485 [Planctomycetes bacterium]|nr:hypothetical protein [Planctomycetota bacterium]
MRHQPREGLTYAELERLRAWVESELRLHRRVEVISVAALALFTLLATAGAYILVVFAVIYFEGASAGLAGTVMLPGLVVAAMFPVYYMLHRKPVVTVPLTQGELRIASRRLDPVALMGGGDQRFEYEVLLFPPWVAGLAINHLARLWKISGFDSWVIARVLAHLYRENRRVHVHDLDMALNEPGLAGAIHALECLPGLLFFTEGELALALSDDLVAQIAQGAQGG